MMAVPCDTPVTIPDEEPTLAVSELLVHVPPLGVTPHAAKVPPMHTVDAPHVSTGSGATVMVVLPAIFLVQLVVALVATTV